MKLLIRTSIWTEHPSAELSNVLKFFFLPNKLVSLLKSDKTTIEHNF